MSKASQSKPASTAVDEIVWLPAEAFFVRRIALDPAADAAGQVELALEAGAPFALEQLFYGFYPAADGLSALIYATHRRIFPNEGWTGATHVLPNFIALLGLPPATGGVRLWTTGSSIVVVAWDGKGTLPCQVLARACEPANETETRTALLAELGRRVGEQTWEMEELAGPVEVKRERKNEGRSASLKYRNSTRVLETALDVRTLEHMDVRDKQVLAERRQEQRRTRILWGLFAAAVTGVVLSAVLEGGLFVSGMLLKRQKAVQDVVAVEVGKIETAQSLSARIEEMAMRQLRPFEMLAVINQSRPAAIQFTRVSTSGLNTLEVEAQTGNASSVGSFETALRGIAALETTEIRDVRLREGNTTFQLTAVFKPGQVTDEGVEGANP